MKADRRMRRTVASGAGPSRVKTADLGFRSGLVLLGPEPISWRSLSVEARSFSLLQAESNSRRSALSLANTLLIPSVSRIGVVRKTSLIPSSTQQTALAFAARFAANAVRF